MDEDPRVAIITPTLGRRPDLLRKMIASVTNQGVNVRLVVVTPDEAVGAGAFAAFSCLKLVTDPELGKAPSRKNGDFVYNGERWTDVSLMRTVRHLRNEWPHSIRARFNPMKHRGRRSTAPVAHIAALSAMTATYADKAPPSQIKIVED